MKKLILLSISVLCLTLSCKKEAETGRTYAEVDTRTSVTLSLPEALPFVEVKSAMSDYIPTFSSGEALSIIASGKVNRLARTGLQGQTAVFTGTVPEASRYTVVYPASLGDGSSVINRSFANQIQSGNASYAHIPYYMMLKDISSLGHLWAENTCAQRLGGSLFSTTILKLVIHVPSGVNYVSRLVLSASDAVFYETNSESSKIKELQLQMDAWSDSENCIVAYFEMASLPVRFSGSTKLSLALYDEGGKPYTRSITPLSQTLEAGTMSCIGVGSEGWSGGSTQQDGSKENPYLIAKLSDLKSMENKLTEGKLTYFKMTADIDMSSETSWVAICPEENNKGISFDGDGHTISNLNCVNTHQHCGFFGFFVGEAKNIKFVNPVIAVDNKGAHLGVLAARIESKSACSSTFIDNIEVTGGRVSYTHQDYRGYVGGMFGTLSAPGVVRNCRFEGTVTNTTAYNDAEKPSFTGGIAGYVWTGNIQIAGCTVRGSVSSTKAIAGFTGGIVAILNKNGAVVENCLCEASVVGHDRTGGIVGGTTALTSGSTVVRNCCCTGDVSTPTGGWTGGIAGSLGDRATVENCFASGSVSGKYMALGGIAGAASNKTNTGASTTYNITVRNCIAWNSSVKSLYPYEYKPDSNSAHISSGAVVGFGGDENVYADCWRTPNMAYAICTTPASWLNSLVLFDQENASASSPLSQKGGSVDGSALTATFHPYHGKAASSSQSASDIARNLSWNTTIWDLSGSEPVLIQ